MKHKSKSRNRTRFQATLTRRQFCSTSASAIAMAFLSEYSFASTGDSHLTRVSNPPTLDELGTEWLDCSQLAHMPSLHNFHEMAACAPDLVGANFLPGGQLYKNSGPRWFIYNTLPLCRMFVDGTAYDSASCRWFAYQSVRRSRIPDIEIETTNRLVTEDLVILWRVKLKNTSATTRTIRVKIETDGIRREVMGQVQLVARSQEFAMANDTAMSEIYYRSVLTLLVLLRTNLWNDRTFITSGERAKGVVYYWGTSFFSTLFAMLEPKQMKEQIKLFLEQDPHESAVIVFKTRRPPSPNTINTPKGWDLRGYAANDLSIFRLAWSYLSVTQDDGFLNERIANQTVKERLHVLATDWKKLLREPSDKLADYGEAPNLLECVPTYIHKVASLNAANVWMMRECAGIMELTGDHKQASELRKEAAQMVKAVMTLYEPGKGVWASVHRDGSRVEVRHCYDFATVGKFMAGDLPFAVREEMVEFVKDELLMEKWMRAQSMCDVAAANSDRPDHGPMGAYDAWPAVTVDAMCALGHWEDAIDFLRRTRLAIYEGVYAQAHEFYGPRRREYDAPVRIAQRGGCMRECTGGGAFAETMINTFFGYIPKLGQQLALFEPHTPRGFVGELRHARHGSDLLAIRSGRDGLHLSKEPDARSR